MGFTILTPSTTHIGVGALTALSTESVIAKKSVLVLSGSRTLERNKTIPELIDELNIHAREVVHIAVPKGEPDNYTVDRFATDARALAPDTVIGIGGGAALDTAKAVAALITNPGSVLDYLEGVGAGKTITERPAAFVAIPSTSGTGTEATKNAVITARDARLKKSMRSDMMVANLVVLDPTLTCSLPQKLTAMSGFDALAQLVESYLSARSNPYTEHLALFGIEHIARSFVRAYEHPDDVNARADMQFAAYLSGHCLANSGLAAGHGFASGIGGNYPNIPHGLIVGILLPHVMRFNLEHAPQKLARLGAVLTGREHINELEAAVQGIEYIEHLQSRLSIPHTLAGFEIDRADVGAIVAASMGNSMRGNPRPVTDSALADFITALL